MQPVGPIETVDLFPELHRQLIEFLSNLTAEEWGNPRYVPLGRSKMSRHICLIDIFEDYPFGEIICRFWSLKRQSIAILNLSAF